MMKQREKYDPKPIDRNLYPNRNAIDAIDYLARQIPNKKSDNNRTPLDNLDPDDITYIQAYLEQVKVAKINQGAVQNNTKYCKTKHDLPVKINPLNKRSNNGSQKNYPNPYSYGARQNEFGSIYKPTYTGPYTSDQGLLNEMGLDNNLYWETFPGDTRNVNLESVLLQKEMTHLPGQRVLTGEEINRFELLPFDPQDTSHIIWRDNMPRGGYPTRIDRLETY